VAAIATAHGADLTVTPRLTGGGLSVRLVFPRPPAALLPASEKAPSEAVGHALT
jgi:hypothetical protein